MQKAGIIIIGTLILVFVGMGFFMKFMMSTPPPRPAGRSGTDAPAPPPVLSRLYTAAEEYAKANPYEYENSISRFQHVAREAPRGSEEARMAREKAKAAEKEWHHLQYVVMPPLLLQTNALAIKHEFDQAVKLLEEYEGAYKDQTAGLRQKQIMEYKTRQKQKAEIDKWERTGPPDRAGDAPAPPPEKRDTSPAPDNTEPESSDKS